MTSSPNNKLFSVILAEDAWQGDAYAIVTVDGAVAYEGDVTASNQGPGETIDLGMFDDTVDHTISVQFTNDAYGGTAATDRNLYVKDVLDGGVSTGQVAALYSASSATFTTGPIPIGTPANPIVIGTGPDTIEFSISEDSWQGNAEYVLLVDGQQQGGVQTATALHDASQDQTVDLKGSFTGTAHQVSVCFINDAYGGTADTDRNLYIDDVTLNGIDLNVAQALYSDGNTTVQVGGAASVATGPDSIIIDASEDAYLGDAEFTVSVDGVQIGGSYSVSASHAAGATQQFTLSGDFGSGSHSVAVTFTNDLYAGTAATDRNLYVDGVTFDGVAVTGAAGALYSDGSLTGTYAPSQPTASVAGSTLNPIAATPVVATPSPAIPAPATPTPAIPAPAIPAPAIPAPAIPAPAASAAPALPTGASADIGLVSVGAPVYAAGSNVETVGVGKEFQTIGAAVAAASDGTVILVDAGTYTNDFATNYAKVTLIAVGGRVDEVATVSPPNDKALLTVENDLTVEGFTFQGVAIPDDAGHNGAGIRVDQGNLTLYNDEFDDNQEGLLTNPGNYSVSIDHSVFNDNGGVDDNGSGNTHNVYIGAIASVTATNSIFENAQVGHEFKSRAAVNTLTNNEFVSGVGIGDGSYDVDLPNGGKDVLTDNTFIKGPNAENYAMVHFGGEGIPYAGSSLTLTGNLFEAEDNPNALAVLNQTAISAKITDNTLSNIAPSSIVSGPASITGNYDGAGNLIQNEDLVGVLPGSTDIIADSAPHTVDIVPGGLQAVEGGAGLLTVTASAGHIVVIGGTGGLDFTETNGSGGNQITTAAGSANVLTLLGGADDIDSEGTDTIYAGDQNQTAVLNGTAIVFGGAGDSNWGVNGTASIDTGPGSAFITLGGTGNVAITGTNSFFELTSNGGTAAWNTTNSGVAVAGSASIGAFTMQAYDGAMQITTSAGLIGTTLHLDEGDAKVESLGLDTIYAGSGNDQVIFNGNGGSVYAGTGALTVYAKGGGGGSFVYGASGDYTIAGDSGGITYEGGATASTVEAILSNISLAGGSGTLTINGGSRDLVTGGTGGLVFNDYGDGANTVTTLSGSSSILDLSGSDSVTSYGNDTITLDSGSSAFALYGASDLTMLAGNSTVDAYGAETISEISGGGVINAHAGANVTLSSSSQVAAYVTGGTLAETLTDPSTAGAISMATVSGPGASSVYASAGAMLTVNTDGSAPVSVTASGTTTINADGNTAIHLGSGSGVVNSTGTGDEIWAGSGSATIKSTGAGSDLTVHGGSGTTNFSQDSDHLTFLGGSGSATLMGGTLDIVGGSGNLTVTGYYGSDVNTFVGGSGSASLSLDALASNITFGTGQTVVHALGWGANDTYTFVAGASGTDVIDNFRPGQDEAVLGAGVTVTSAAITNGSAQFVLSNGANVTFTGLTNTQNVFKAP